MSKIYCISIAGVIAGLFLFPCLDAQYKPIQHRAPSEGEIAVSKPGCYGRPGTKYILVNDISSPRSAIFLGKDVTLDLNGFTITYADGNYGHVPNYGFEDGLAGWDLSNAPSAKVENAEDVHVFIGRKILRLKAGDEITSGYVNFPESGRSYYAMCGVTGTYYYDLKSDLSNDMKVSIFVDDANGNEVKCITAYSDSVMVSCPVIRRSPRLGGGFVFAHLNKLPAGKYRIRVKAETDCLVDEIDIRPAMDAGIGIVEKTNPIGHYDHLYNNGHSAFFDYTSDASTGEPGPEIPVVKGSGTVTIKNGIIKNATEGVLSWGVQSTAENVRIILDNVKIISSGINTTAVDVEQATITNCTFDIINPFIINRHGSEFYAVDLRGEQASEVSFSEFYGGQGCLSVKGRMSSVHNNFFANRQTVTNHYSIMAMGDGSRIFENRFEPEIGSGIEIFRNKYIEIFNNEFHINAAPPSCEYNDHLSTNAIRIADYGAATGSPNGCFGNRIYNNRFFIKGRYYEKYPDFIPMASAFFYSASAGDNDIFGNEITVDQENPGTKAEAYAFYVGNARGGKLYNNRIVTNVTPIWIACTYGTAENTILSGNTIEKAPKSADFSPVKMGSGYTATGTEFRSNAFSGIDFSIDATEKQHTYKVFWTLEIKLTDKTGKPLRGAEAIVTDSSGKVVLQATSNTQGEVRTELPEYFAEGKKKIYFSPYTIRSGKEKAEVDLKKNTEVSIILR